MKHLERMAVIAACSALMFTIVTTIIVEEMNTKYFEFFLFLGVGSLLLAMLYAWMAATKNP